MKTALIIGSTGFLGSQLLQLLLESPRYDKVISFVKRDSGVKHPKLTEHIIDFDKPETYGHFVHGDDFFCTIGTTIKTAGSKEAFRKVDYQYPWQFSVFAFQNNVRQFLVISSIGADHHSGNFYLKTKGDLETVLKDSDLQSVAVLRPSVLTGDRKEFRLGEKVGGTLMNAFSFLLLGSLKKYKPIKGEVVVQAMLSIAQLESPGFAVYESNELQRIGKL